MSVDKTFLGTGWGFPPEFGRTAREVRMVSAESDIEESLRILLSTSPGERVMRPTYGCGLRRMIFENISESTVTEIKDTVERAVLFFEHRITLDRVEVDTGASAEGLIRILLEYRVRTTNARRNMVYPFYIYEGATDGF